jgi:hypothetical protein
VARTNRRRQWPPANELSVNLSLHGKMPNFTIFLVPVHRAADLKNILKPDFTIDVTGKINEMLKNVVS